MLINTCCDVVMECFTVCFRSRQVQQQMHSLGSLMALAHKVIRVSHDGPGLQNMQAKFEELDVMVTSGNFVS